MESLTYHLTHFRMDFATGRFKGESYPVVFEYFGHVETENQFFLSKFSAISLGFSALIVLNDFTPHLPTVIADVKQWSCTDSVVLKQFQAMLYKHKISLRGRKVVSLTATIINGDLNVCISFLQLGRIPFLPKSVKQVFSELDSK